MAGGPVSTRDDRQVVLTTDRLIVTTWLMDDVEALHQVHSDPQTMTFVRHGRPESRAEVTELVAKYRREQAARGWTKWRVADRTGELVGRAGFGGEEANRGLSYLIRRALWGRGLATEVAAALVDWHLMHAPDVRLGATVAVGNDASVRVLEKVGFDEVGLETFEGIPCRSFALCLG